MAGILRATNLTRGTVLCERLENAGGLAGQSRGLLGREGLDPDAGMLFENGGPVPVMWMHMFFMKFAIDLVFLDREGKVLKIDRNLKPWRLSSAVFRARRALELAAGAAERAATQDGDRIIVEPANSLGLASRK
ncbi:MAG: DUF192 domain-containing protein [Candidatus Binataceae bacterium]